MNGIATVRERFIHQLRARGVVFPLSKSEEQTGKSCERMRVFLNTDGSPRAAQSGGEVTSVRYAKRSLLPVPAVPLPVLGDFVVEAQSQAPHMFAYEVVVVEQGGG
jgi:hypothetical protein